MQGKTLYSNNRYILNAGGYTQFSRDMGFPHIIDILNAGGYTQFSRDMSYGMPLTR